MKIRIRTKRIVAAGLSAVLLINTLPLEWIGQGSVSVQAAELTDCRLPISGLCDLKNLSPDGLITDMPEFPAKITEMEDIESPDDAGLTGLPETYRVQTPYGQETEAA